MSNLENPCLLTELRGEFGDNSNAKFGEIRIVLLLPANYRTVLNVGKSSGDGCIARTITPGVKFSTSASGELTDTFTLPSIASSTDMFINNSSNEAITAVIFISNKYILSELKNNQASVEAGARIYSETYKGESNDWLPNITVIKSDVAPISKIVGTITDLKGFYNATFIRIAEQNNATTDDWSIFTKLTNIDLDSNVSGDIVKLGALTDLTNFAFGKSKCSGTIESWVQAQRANGRTTGSVTGNSSNISNVTFNGIRGNAKGGVSWTATTITMNGITIDA